MEINELLQKPLKDNGKNIQKAFSQIAENLFQNFCIQCGTKKYYFAEVEFYYYDDQDCNKPEMDWQTVTYDRKKEAGEFFYHLSGCDICFDSNLRTNEKGEKVGHGGGILIRSIIDENEKVTAGPMKCVNEMLNACGNGRAPFLKQNKNNMELVVQETYRFLGDKDFKTIDTHTNSDGILKLAFFNAKIKKELWNEARTSYFTYRFKHDIK